MNDLGKRFFGAVLFLMIGGAFLNAAAQAERRVDEIRKIYQKTNEQIAESNENGEYSSVFLTELAVNKNNGSYPAVGIYQPVVKFYYTYGDREKNPYPNRLLKIEIEIKRAANIEKYEYLFNEKAELIFYFEGKTGEENLVEKRLYFQNELLIKFLDGDKTRDLRSKFTKNQVLSVLLEKKKLARIFQNTLNY